MVRLNSTRSNSELETAGDRRFPYYYAALAMALPAIMLGIQISGWISFRQMIRDGHTDFRNLYTAGYMVRTGHGSQIYDYAAQKTFQDALVSPEQVAVPFLRPAYQALLFSGFSFLPYRQAYYAFLAFNLALLLICIRLLFQFTDNLARIWHGLPIAIFLFLPIGAALMQGQDSIILLALLAGALAFIRRGREFLAGALIACGLFKFQIVIPIAVLFLVWRRWKFSAGFASVAAILAAISLWIAGAGGSAVYCRSMLQIGVTHGLSSGLPLPVERMANLHGALTGILGPSRAQLLVTLACSLALIIFAATRRAQGIDALIIAIPVSALVSYYLFIHDMSILIIPILVVANRAAAWERLGLMDDTLEMGLAALLFVSPACMTFLPFHWFWIVAFPLLAFAIVVSLPRRVSSSVSLCAP